MAEKSRHVSLGFSVDFDSTPDTEIPLTAYLFTASGRLLASAPVSKGKTTLKGEAGGRKDLRLFIAPAPPVGEGEEEINLAAMERLRAYEPVWNVGASGIVALQPIPRSLWCCWLRSCRVRGRVVVPTKVGGVEQDLSLPHARVHICEVDPFRLILKRIPTIHIFQLRDDLLKILDRRWIPIPRPGPGPDPGPWINSGLNLSDNSVFHGVGGWREEVMLNPQPEPPRPEQRLDLETAARAIEAALPQNSRVKLLSGSSLVVRDTLAMHLEAFWPVLCLWHWHWPWLWRLLRTWERKTVETNAQGNFDTTIWYSPFGDHPDLYFWVDYWIDQAWTPVYKPTVFCHTWWNYPCGTEVILHVSDPRVNATVPGPDIPAGSVLVERIGDTWLGAIRSDGTTEALQMPGGLGDMPHAFGHVLSPHVEFSSLLSPGVTHYRWAYQHVTEDGAAIEPGEPWHVVSLPLSRIYMEIVNVGGREVWHRGSVPLGPVAAGGQVVFMIPPHEPPENPNQIDAWWDFCRNNEASAFFNTTLAYPDAGLAAGWVKLRLELFRLTGDVLQRVSPGGGFQVPTPDYRGVGDMNSISAGAAYVENLQDALCSNPASPVQVFVLKLCIENRPTHANIIPASVPGSQTGCTGILAYSSGTNPDVDLSFNAAQPGGFGGYVFGVQLGHLNNQVQESSSGAVGVAGGNSYGYVPATQTYRKQVHALTLLTHNHARDSCICPPVPAVSDTLCPDATRHAVDCVVDSGAFSEVLSVFAAVTNGYDRLQWLDRYDHAGFALVKN